MYKNSKSLIKATALEMFNKRGLECVGVREIGRRLEISPGNISYYFPSKNDLIIEIYREFVEKTGALLTEFQSKDNRQPCDLLLLLQKVMELQQSYRCLFLSFNYLTQIEALENEVYQNDKKWRYEVGLLMSRWNSHGLVYSHAGSEAVTFFDMIKLILVYQFTDSKIHSGNASGDAGVRAYHHRLASLFRLYFKNLPC